MLQILNNAGIQWSKVNLKGQTSCFHVRFTSKMSSPVEYQMIQRYEQINKMSNYKGFEKHYESKVQNVRVTFVVDSISFSIKKIALTSQIIFQNNMCVLSQTKKEVKSGGTHYLKMEKSEAIFSPQVTQNTTFHTNWPSNYTYNGQFQVTVYLVVSINHKECASLHQVALFATCTQAIRTPTPWHHTGTGER